MMPKILKFLLREGQPHLVLEGGSRTMVCGKNSVDLNFYGAMTSYFPNVHFTKVLVYRLASTFVIGPSECLAVTQSSHCKILLSSATLVVLCRWLNTMTPHTH